MRKLSLILTIVLLGTVLFAAYPEKPLHIIVPFSAGGGTDFLIRNFSQILQKYYPKPIVIENVPGAGSAIGMKRLYNSKPDGYTMGVPGTHLLTAELKGFVDFPWDALTHVAVLNTEPYVIAVRKDSKWKTIEELLEDAKENPFTITMGTAGAGALTDIVAHAINHRTGAKFVVVPFNGGAKERAALLGGHISAGVFSGSEVLPYVGEEGELRVLATVGEKRSPLYPDVPSLGELGYKGIPAGSVRGLAFPPNTPQEIVKKFEEILLKAVNDPEWKEFSKKYGYVDTFCVGEDMMKFYKSLYESLKEIMKEMGLIK